MADRVTVSASKAQEIIDDEALAEEELLDELEEFDIPAHIREARLEHFKKQAQQLGQLKDTGHGHYGELSIEKEFLTLTTSVQKCVVHFFHSDFGRCSIMDGHLEKLSEKYFGTKFAKINVDIAHFFVEKLKIRVLPAVMCFVKGEIVDKIVGFEQLGSSDNFPTSVLEKRLSLSGVIEVDELDSDEEFSTKKEKKSILGGVAKKDSDEDDDDDDY